MSELPPPVATALHASLPDVAQRTVAAIIAEVQEYADPLRGELGTNITRAVELALATFLRLAEAAGSERAGEQLLPALEAAYALGRGEARSGRTMNALLSAYRVGARVAWEQWGGTALGSGLRPDRLVSFASLVFAYIDQLSASSVNGHTDELATSGRVRDHYLERLSLALVAGAPADELEQRAERAGWQPPGSLTCLIAASAHTGWIRSQLDPSTLTVAADAIDGLTLTDATVHLVPDVGGRRPALLSSLASRGWVLGPERPWPDVASSFRRALRALDLYGARPTVVDTEAHLADLVVAADAEALADLRAQALQPLATLKPDVADRLAATLRAWLLHQGRRDDVARDLVVHPQTVRYRMTQIRDLYGDRLADPVAVRDLVVALAGDGH